MYSEDETNEHLLLLANTFLQTLYYDINGITGDVQRPFGRGGKETWRIWEDVLQIVRIMPDGARDNVTGYQHYTISQIDYAQRLWAEVLPFIQTKCRLELVK